jgi:hypothetical protein
LVLEVSFSSKICWENSSFIKIWQDQRVDFSHLWEYLSGEWRRLHNKELYALYSSPNIKLKIKSLGSIVNCRNRNTWSWHSSASV